MSKTKRILAFVLAAVLAVVVLTGCKSIAQKVFGSSNEVQEDDTTQWAVLSSDPLVIDGIADTTAKYATARANGALNIVFNGIWSRQTEYFTVPSGLLSIYGCGTTAAKAQITRAERNCGTTDGGAQKFKVSLWKRWTAARSMWTTPPSISPPTARTTTATSATLTPTQATALPFPTIPAATTSTV